jgi:hypothetical protein
MIVCQGLFSMVFFWPRNRILLAEGITMHSVDFLKQTAQEFQTLHYWLRLAVNAVGSTLIFTGFLKFYRHSIMFNDSPTQKPSGQGG